MCIKAGKNELGSVRALMTMSLNSIVADVFDIDLDDLDPALSLRDDLHMGEQQKAELGELIAEYFDNLSVDLDQMDTLHDLFSRVVEAEFVGLAHLM